MWLETLTYVNHSVFTLKSRNDATERPLCQDLAHSVTLLCFIYCSLLFSNRSLKKGMRGSHWGVIMDKSNHVIFVWALLWQQHSLVMCPLRFDWSNSLHLMALSVCVKCVYKWKSIFAPPGDSVCSSFVSANCDESSKPCFRGSNWKDTRTPHIVCIYNPRSFCPRIDLFTALRERISEDPHACLLLLEPVSSLFLQLHDIRIHISNFTWPILQTTKIRQDQDSGLADNAPLQHVEDS